MIAFTLQLQGWVFAPQILKLKNLSYFRKYIYFTWLIIALQYWFDFCHTSTWINCKLYICSLAQESASHLLPIPTPLGYHRQIACIDMYVWNLEGWFWWNCLRSSSGDRDIENSLLGRGGGEEEGGEMDGQCSVEAYTLT